MQHNFTYPNEYHIAQETPQKGAPSVGEGQEGQGKVKYSLINKMQARVVRWQFHISKCKCSNWGTLQDLWINPLG